MLVLVVAIIGIILVKSNPETGSLRIGVMIPATGGLASYGEPAQKVADIAVAEINANGGINGRKLEIVYANHKCDPKEMMLAYEGLLMQNINILNTVACSGTVAGIAPGLESKGVVLLGTAISASKLTGVSPAFYRNWAADSQEAKVLVDQIIKNGYKNIAIMYEETDYAKGLKIDLENNLKGTDVKITSESFATGALDVRTQLTKLKSVKPDAMLVSVQTGASGEVVLNQMEKLNFTPKMLVNYNILKATAVLKAHVALLEGAIGADYFIKDSAGLDKVLAQYKATYGVDCPQRNICAMEYDAIQMLAQGLREKGDSVSGMRTYLSTATYSGVSGEVSFDAKNDRNNSEYVPFTIKNGVSVKI